MYILEKDVLSKEYLGKRERFADIINGFFFHGTQIIKPENITELDTAVNRIWKKTGWIKGAVFYRDLLRRIELSVQCFIVGIEEQSAVDYTIPIRVMGYDLQGYEKQLQDLKKKHKTLKDLTGSEFLSGIRKTDQLEPIVTIVIYFGEKEWDGPMDLHGMLAIEEIPTQLRKMIPNYPVHILDVRRYTHLENFRTDLRILFEFLKSALDKKHLSSYIKKMEKEKITISEDTYDMIALMADIPNAEKIKYNYVNGKGDIIMCRAWEELMEDIREEGRKKGREEGREKGRDEGVRLALTVINLARKDLSSGEIAEKCGISECKVRDILDLNI